MGPCWNFASPPYLYGQIVHRVSEQQLVVDMYNNTHRVFAGMKLIDGVFMATHRRIAQSIGFDEVNFNNFHLYDLDFSYRAFLAGHNIAICCDLGIVHYSLGNFDEVWEVYAERFMKKFRDQIVEIPRPRSHWNSVLVSTRQEAKERMNHELWPPFSE